MRALLDQQAALNTLTHSGSTKTMNGYIASIQSTRYGIVMPVTCMSIAYRNKPAMFLSQRPS